MVATPIVIPDDTPLNKAIAKPNCETIILEKHLSLITKFLFEQQHLYQWNHKIQSDLEHPTINHDEEKTILIDITSSVNRIKRNPKKIVDMQQCSIVFSLPKNEYQSPPTNKENNTCKTNLRQFTSSAQFLEQSISQQSVLKRDDDFEKTQIIHRASESLLKKGKLRLKQLKITGKKQLRKFAFPYV